MSCIIFYLASTECGSNMRGKVDWDDEENEESRMQLSEEARETEGSDEDDSSDEEQCIMSYLSTLMRCLSTLMICLCTVMRRLSTLTLFSPGGLWRPYQNLKLNNFKAVKAMTTKFSDFS